MTTGTDNNRGFTMIELMIVIAIIGIVSTTSLIRIDFFGTEQGRELEQLLTFVRSQHARSLSETTTVLVVFAGTEDEITAENTEGDVLDTVDLDEWSIETSGETPLTLTPWNVRGDRITLSADDRELTLVPDLTRTVREQS